MHSTLRDAPAQERKFLGNFDPRLLYGTSTNPYHSRETSLRRLDAAITAQHDRYACVGGIGEIRRREQPRRPHCRVAANCDIDAPPSKSQSKKFKSQCSSPPHILARDGSMLGPEHYRTDMSWMLSAAQMQSMGLSLQWDGIDAALQDVSAKLGISDRGTNDFDLDATLQCVVSCPRNITLDGRKLMTQAEGSDEDTLTLVVLCESGSAPSASSTRMHHAQPAATVSFGKRGEHGQAFLFDAVGAGSYAAWYNVEEAGITFPTSDALMVVYKVRSVRKTATTKAASPRVWCSQTASTLSHVPPELGNTIKQFLDHKSLYCLKATCRDLRPSTSCDAELLSTLIRECSQGIEDSCRQNGKSSLGLLLSHTYSDGSPRGCDAILYDAAKMAYPETENQVRVQDGIIRVEVMTSKSSGASKRRVMIVQDKQEEPLPPQDLSLRSPPSQFADTATPAALWSTLSTVPRPRSIEEISCDTYGSLFGDIRVEYELEGKMLHPKAETSFPLSQERVDNILGLKDPLDTMTLHHRDGDAKFTISYYRCSYVCVDLNVSSSSQDVTLHSAKMVADIPSQPHSLADRIQSSKSVCWVDSRRGSLLSDSFGESFSSSMNA